MKVDKSNSWKEKIDPALDDLIKVCLDYINLTRICSTDTHKRYIVRQAATVRLSPSISSGIHMHPSDEEKRRPKPATTTI